MIAAVDSNKNKFVTVPTPAGVNFVLTQASIYTNRSISSASMRVKVKSAPNPLLPGVTSLISTQEIPKRTDAQTVSLGLDLLVKPNTLAAAAAGEIPGIDLCVKSGSYVRCVHSDRQTLEPIDPRGSAQGCGAAGESFQANITRGGSRAGMTLVCIECGETSEDGEGWKAELAVVLEGGGEPDEVRSLPELLVTRVQRRVTVSAPLREAFERLSLGTTEAPPPRRILHVYNLGNRMVEPNPDAQTAGAFFRWKRWL